MHTIQIEVTHTRLGHGDKIIVHYMGDTWELPYCWETIVMLYAMESKCKTSWRYSCDVWQLYPQFTLDQTGSTIYNVLF